jgi:protein-tyrosine phosphatase
LSEKIKICFVCHGNIIRSPLAENLFRYLVETAGVGDKYVIDSAGVDSWHVGEKPDRRMRRVAASHGFNYSGSARQFQKSDLDHFDLIIGMDSSNRRALISLAENPEQSEKIFLLRKFDPLGGPDLPVPDPYYGGIDGFEEVYRIIVRSCQGLLDYFEDDMER